MSWEGFGTEPSWLAAVREASQWICHCPVHRINAFTPRQPLFTRLHLHLNHLQQICFLTVVPTIHLSLLSIVRQTKPICILILREVSVVVVSKHDFSVKFEAVKFPLNEVWNLNRAGAGFVQASPEAQTGWIGRL